MKPSNSNSNLVAAAKAAIASAKTVEELRQAQAVVLTCGLGLTLKGAAEALGVSKGWVSKLRSQFMAGRLVGDDKRPRRGGRRRANMSVADEKEFLNSLLSRRKDKPKIAAKDVKLALEQRLERPVPMSSVYNFLRRQGGAKALIQRPGAVDSVAERIAEPDARDLALANLLDPTKSDLFSI